MRWVSSGWRIRVRLPGNAEVNNGVATPLPRGLLRRLRDCRASLAMTERNTENVRMTHSVDLRAAPIWEMMSAPAIRRPDRT